MLASRTLLQIRRREEVCRALLFPRVLLFLRVPRGLVEEGETYLVTHRPLGGTLPMAYASLNTGSRAIAEKGLSVL